MVSAAQLYREVTAQLQKAGCDSPAFDAQCLMEDIGHLPPHGLPVADERSVSDDTAAAVRAAASERAAGRPLQYILGQWGFLRLTLAVGEGVLVPRPDTECLCEAAAAWLDAVPRDDAPFRVLDLCAGSGCVGLGVASLAKTPIAVTAVELSDAARGYLERNIARYPQYAVTARQADVLRDAARFEDEWMAILSNPPYIPTADLDGLMREVQQEPRMALDGDADGLRFYRVIASEWAPKLRPGGLCAVEVGAGQADDVAALFAAAGLTRVQVLPDLAGIPRVVMGERPDEVTIVPWEERYAADFVRLSVEWLEEYVRVEEADLAILHHPHEAVLDNGGMIFFAKRGERVVGTVSMIRVGDRFELAKLGVTGSCRGERIGDRLMTRAIAYARENGAREVYLFTNHKLQAAIHLYHKYGFVDVPLEDNEYEESDMKMRLTLC